MKIGSQKKSRGNVLLAALVAAGVIGITVMSYLALVSAQYRAIARSQSWNSAIPVAEAGVEEALGHLYYRASNLNSDGWAPGAHNTFSKSGAIGDGRYFVIISNGPPPVIYSTGYGQVPLAGAEVQRTIRVDTINNNPFAQGLVAKDRISFSGGGVLDSFDPTDPNYSTNGKYDPAKRKSNGKVLSNSKLLGAISVDTAHVYGSAFTGPGGTVGCNSGAVGDAAWNASHSGIEPGHFTADANVNFPDVAPPFTTGYKTPGPQIVAGTNYTYALGNGNWRMSSCAVNGGQSMIVFGTAIFYVTGDFTTSGSGYVYIAPKASLKLYVGGSSCTVSGSGVVNGTGLAKNFTIYGLNTCATCTYSGSSEFIGTVYAPCAAFTFSGSAGACGAFSAASVVISGSAGVHCDESLGNDGNLFIVTSWNEL